MTLRVVVAISWIVAGPGQVALAAAQDAPGREPGWVERFLAEVPADACAAAAIHASPGESMRSVLSALDPAVRDMLDEVLRQTGAYTGAADLIEGLQVPLADRIGVVFRRRTEAPSAEIPVHDPAPLPEVAIVLWSRRDADRQPMDAIIAMLRVHAHRLGFQKVFQMNLGPGGEDGDRILELANPALPGTGEIACGRLGRRLVVGNSGPLIARIARMGQHAPAPGAPSFAQAFRQLDIVEPKAGTAAVFLRGQQLRKWMDDCEAHSRNRERNPDPGWMQSRRAVVESELFGLELARTFESIAALPEDARQRFERAVEERLQQVWSERQAERERLLVELLDKARAATDLFATAYVQMVLDPRSIEAAVRALAGR